MIRSALRPSDPSHAAHENRLLHEQYDRLFKSIVSGDWANESEGDVEAPTGFFSLILIEYNECEEVWNAFASYPDLSDCQMKVLWSGMLAGYYLTTEDSNGIIRVYAYDEPDDARRAYEALVHQFGEWYDADQADEHGLDGL